MASREKSRTFHKEVVFDINRKFRTRFSKEMTIRKSKARKFENSKIGNSKTRKSYLRSSSESTPDSTFSSLATSSSFSQMISNLNSISSEFLRTLF